MRRGIWRIIRSVGSEREKKCCLFQGLFTGASRIYARNNNCFFLLQIIRADKKFLTCKDSVRVLVW